MIISSGITRSLSQVIASGFVEFTTVGTNQSITSGMIPAGVTRVRVHLIGGGGGAGSGTNGGSSAFSAGGVSVIASGGGATGQPFGSSPQTGGSGGGVSAVAGVVGSAVGGNGGDYNTNADGSQGGIGIDVGIGMGGGGGGGGYRIICCGTTNYIGTGGQVGLNPSIGPYGKGGAGGGYGSGQSLPVYGSLGGAGSDGTAFNLGGGGGGGYAMFYANINGATTYTNAVTIGNKGSTNSQSGYCRIQWGSGI